MAAYLKGSEDHVVVGNLPPDQDPDENKMDEDEQPIGERPDGDEQPEEVNQDLVQTYKATLTYTNHIVASTVKASLEMSVIEDLSNMEDEDPGVDLEVPASEHLRRSLRNLMKYAVNMIDREELDGENQEETDSDVSDSGVEDNNRIVIREEPMDFELF